MSRPAARGALTGMSAFALVWFGQLISSVGSQLTSFALGIWVYQRPGGSVTQLALLALAAALPGVLLAPFAGALVDRWDRRRVMLLGDTGAAISTLAVVLLLLGGQVALWQIYLSVVARAVCGVFQWLAYSASVPLLVPSAQLGRANGLRQIGFAAGQVLAPALAGLLLTTVGLAGVLLIDMVSFACAVATLLPVRIPRPPASAEPHESLAQDIRDAWGYVAARRGLLGLLGLIAANNLLLGLVGVLVTPLGLSVTTAEWVGAVMSAGGLALVASSVLMGAWGGPRRQILGVVGAMLLGGLSIVLGGIRPSLPLFFVAAAGFFFSVPIENTCTDTLLQRKVPPALQGRVFALAEMLAAAAVPLSYLLAGPLADRVFTPLVQPGSPWAGPLALLLGEGPGRGIGLLFVVAGLLYMLLALASLLLPQVRRIDDDLPDAPAEPAAQPG